MDHLSNRAQVDVMALVLVMLTVVFSTPAAAQKPNSKKGSGKAAKQEAPQKIRLPDSVRSKEPVDMDVAKTIASRRSAVVASASRLDTQIDFELSKHNKLPNSIASDEVFLRRVYLDVAGRIPTLAEAKAFLDSTNPDRRADLIDNLLGSPDYVSNMYNFWADTLRLVDSPQPNIIFEPFEAYVKESIRTNKQYDQWVYEMLTADGKIWENPATGYQLRDDGMPLPYVDNTIRVFLGTQIGCAQCHDHPFDQWTQYQFYQLAAYTSGTRTRIQKGDPGFDKQNPANELIKQAGEKAEKGRVDGNFQRVARANTYSVSEKPASLRLPHDYAYSDAKPKDLVKPAVLWGHVPATAAKKSPREQFAAWLTSAENPQFSKMIVNRLWKRFLGVGLVEPIDDFRDEHVCVNESAMDHLCKELISQDFNLKELIRVILYSKSYQREATDYDMSSGEPYYFQGPIVRRMTAEQVWDSILTLAVHNPWPFQRPTAEQIKESVDVDFGTANLTKVEAVSKRYAETFANGAYRRTINKHAYQGNVLCRASELPSPAPAEHFLRQFGQGDRETINCSQQEATVPQILAMFNGPITHVMLEAGSAIYDNVVAIENTRERIDAIFISVLTRNPNSQDRSIAAGELAKQKIDGVGYGNIIWGLLNTREFLFIQ